MKRIVLSGLLALCIAGFASAQMGPWGMGRRGFSPAPAAEQVKVSGNLSIVHGRIAVVSNDTVYYAGGLNRFVGFIDGLKEGAMVNLEGAAYQFSGDGKVKFLRVNKLSLNGKDYDLSPPADGFAAPGSSFPSRGYYNSRGRHR
jgi:hypothetical protein